MRISDWSSDVCSSDLAVERGEYAHYMLKEIYEQPRALADTLSERLLGDHVLEAALGPAASRILPLVQSVHIVACGTSYHAGLVARYYLEQGARVPCTVEDASAYRYRDPVDRKSVVEGKSLYVRVDTGGRRIIK